MADNLAPSSQPQVVTIDVLPDDVLLAIFDFYVVRSRDLDFIVIAFGTFDDTIRKIRSWQSLIHVCRRWRSLVFGSRHRLDLQLCCTTNTPANKTLDVWPALPLLVKGDVSNTTLDNVIAELKHSDRICQISLNIMSLYTTSQAEIDNFWTAMQMPFPELASLCLSNYERLSYEPFLPDSFLGGSASRLRFLSLYSISFPPKLLLTAPHLVYLWLVNIPHSGYISPETMVTFLSTLTNLVQLRLEFESPQSCPDQENRLSPPPTRSVLPSLMTFLFKGASEYLEELVALIDTPQLFQFWIMFFNDIDFETPELIQFIPRTFEAPKDVQVEFGRRGASFTLDLQAPPAASVRVEISCSVPDWQLSSLAQIGTSCLSILSAAESLHINEQPRSQLDWKDGIENTDWLELLLPFTAVKDLYLSKQFAPRIAPTLQELTEGRTDVLPALQNLFLEGYQPSEPVHKGIAQLISARQLTISIWERDLDETSSQVSS